MPPIAPRLALGAVLLAGVAVGARYALHTPLWQVPDEPAHYNYVAQLADGPPGLPVLTVEDYPYARLEALKAAGFPRGADVRGIAYEDYQPPAYYALGIPVIAAAGPSVAERVRLLRLWGVLLGALTATLGWAVARRVAPRDPGLAVATASFVAFLPMHVAMNAAVNNDPLAYVVSAALLYVALGRATQASAPVRGTLGAGALVGFGLLTKASVYPCIALVPVADLIAMRRQPRAFRRAVVIRMVATLGIGALVALPWLARNVLVYGAGDPLGTRRHDVVVVGQPRTADWIAAHGVGAWAERLVLFTFESFWGVFGWLGVFMERWVYLVLAAATLASAAGLVTCALRIRRGAATPRVRGAHLAIICALIGLMGALFTVYNGAFVQHQGRYMFPALVPIALLFNLGLQGAIETLARRCGFGARARQLGDAGILAFAACLAVLAWVALTRYIVPGLT